MNLLIAIALMRVAPVGRLRQIVSGYQLLSAVALIIALVPFVANQLRIAIYPQLEPQYNQYQLVRLWGHTRVRACRTADAYAGTQGQ